MGGTTPALALPYPTGTDRVADGDNAIQSLAEAVEARQGIAASAYLNTTTVPVGGGVLAATETSDPLGMYAAGVFTAPRKGIYFCNACCGIGSGGLGGVRLLTMEWKVSGGSMAEVARVGMPMSASLALGLSLAAPRHLLVGDQIQFKVYHDSTAGLTVTAIHLGVALIAGDRVTTWLAVLAWMALGGTLGAAAAYVILTGRPQPGGRHSTTDEGKDDDRTDT